MEAKRETFWLVPYDLWFWAIFGANLKQWRMTNKEKSNFAPFLYCNVTKKIFIQNPESFFQMWSNFDNVF